MALRPSKPPSCLLHRSELEGDGAFVKLQQLGVEGLDFLGSGIGDEDALKLQQSPGQVINFLPARDASGVNCLTISVILILKYMYGSEKCT